MPIRCCRHLNGCPSELSRVLKKLTWYADKVRLPYHPPTHSQLPFAPTNIGASKRLTLDWVRVSLKSKSWNWLGRFATAARLPILLCAHYSKESRKKKQVTALVVTATPPALLRVVLEHLHALRRTRAA